ncbi:MAG: dephospho-CoA kinase [Leptospiraceae bacterium]
MKKLSWKGKRFFLGLTGMPGSGKSTAREILAKLGCKTLDADALAHDVLDQPDTLQEIANLFGADVVQNGKANRAAIADRVFKDRELLEKLNSLIHPRVRKKAMERMNAFPEGSIIVYDVPLLFEAELNKEMDATLVIRSSFPVRLDRVKSRSWTEEDLKSRDRHHLPDKAERADFVVENDGQIQAMASELEALLLKIKAAKP